MQSRCCTSLQGMRLQQAPEQEPHVQHARLLLQALNRPQSRAETDAFNKMHFQQLRLARQHSHRPTAVTPKVTCSACSWLAQRGKLCVLH